MPEFKQKNVNLLIVSHETVDTKMSGPGMRYFEIAYALCQDFNVTLAVPCESTIELPRVRIASYMETTPGDLRQLVKDNDVVLLTPFTLHKFPFFESVSIPLVFDLYDPYIFENLFYYQNEPL